MIDVILGEDNFSKEIADKLNAKFVKINSFIFPDSETKPVIEDEDEIKGRTLLVLRANRFRPSINDCIMKIYFICNPFTSGHLDSFIAPDFRCPNNIGIIVISSKFLAS